MAIDAGVDFDFIEIGTSNFETLIQLALRETKGTIMIMINWHARALSSVRIKALSIDTMSRGFVFFKA